MVGSKSLAVSYKVSCFLSSKSCLGLGGSWPQASLILSRRRVLCELCSPQQKNFFQCLPEFGS